MTDAYEHGAAFCGDYCEKCANRPDDCPGCIPSLHMDCHFIQCGLKKGVAHCGLCADFSCQELTDFIPDDRPECPGGYHIENLWARTRIGTPAWPEAQRNKWKS